MADVGWDLVAFHESVACNGLDYKAPAAGETYYTVNGDDLKTRGSGAVKFASCITAAIANFDEWRFHRTLDPDWVHTRMFHRDQTGALSNNDVMYLNYLFGNNENIRAQADNGNNAQVESIALGMAYGMDPMFSVGMPTFQIPEGAAWVQGTGATTVTANTWSNATITWAKNFKQEATYRILGMVGYSATGYLGRFKFKADSPTKGFAPGGFIGDTAILSLPCYAKFGSFKGANPPSVEMLCSAGDTAQYIDMLVIEG